LCYIIGGNAGSVRTLSHTDVFPPKLISRDTFYAALRAGELDCCLRDLDGRAVADTAELRCRLAEALFHHGRRDEAVTCCRQALPHVGGDPALLELCAWVFSNDARHADAAAAYRSLLALSPHWIDGHRHLSAALAAAGHGEEAIRHARAAADGAADNAEYARHAGQLLLAAGGPAEAAEYLGRALALDPADPAALCLAATTCGDLGHIDEAVDLARRAAATAAGDAAVAIQAAELLMRWQRPEEGAEVLAGIPAKAASPRLWRVLSAAEMLCGRLDAALCAVERALAAAPDEAEYHVHRGHLLWRLGDSAGAAAAFARAAALDPANRDAPRAQLGLFLADGRASEATAVGGDLLRRFPDDRPAAEAVLHLLNHRLDTIDGDYVVLPGDGARPRQPRPAPRWRDRLGAQRRVIRALMLRESRTRFADLRLGYGWALLEPVLHIALLSATFAVLMHGRPPIGTQFFIFYYTGLIPYHLFVHSSGGMSHAITGNAAVLQLPPVTVFDVIAARGVLEIATDLIVAALLLAGFAAAGLAVMPDDLWGASLALAAIAALGIGCGFVNAVVTVFWRSWERAYGQLTRVLYFVSGIFYVPGMMPDWARDVLAWNPVLQAIDWFRAGFFASYQPHWLDRSYLVVLAIVALLLGLALERGLRRRLRQPL
jgi:ABC-type polysaccharide/polyol phosphate export permease/Flp pilus assembly protein TadD